ncbi:MAG TPA: hypothetical protein VG164_15470 [Trebonia sp.]|nr:hypothetical protein [Trebonia sp.]
MTDTGDGRLIPFRRVADADQDAAPRERFEHVLDDDPDDPQPVHPPGGFGLPATRDDRRPVVPPALRSREALRAETDRHAEQLRYEASFHGLRAPWYLLKTVLWALWGTLVLADRLRRWWWVTEGTGARLVAAIDNDGREYRSQHLHQRKVRGERGIVITACALAALVAGVLVTRTVPWAWCGIAPVLAVLAARAGGPEGRPIITPSMTEPVVRVVSQDTVVRAYAAAGLCKPGTEGQELGLGVMARDKRGTGTFVPVYLPYGGTYAKVMGSLAALASGLDVKVSQLFLTPDDTSERRHTLWIADEDPLAKSAGRTPLLDLKSRNLWRDLWPMGLDQFGDRVRISLLWVSFLIGSQPRKGKTFTARALALFAALDPHVRITIADGSSKPDWRPFQLIAHRTVFGTRPTRDGDPGEKLLAEVQAIERHMEDTGNFLSTLSTAECPEGKLTEELCRKYPKKLFLWLLVMEEAYFYYELADTELSKKIAQSLSNIRSAGPALGVILVTSLQKPAGVGSTQAIKELFTRYRDNHEVRIALKCGNRHVSEAVLGGGAEEGFDASTLPDGKKYRGISILWGHPDLEHTPTVRAYLADAEDAEAIIKAARKYREAAGTLTGEAIGEEWADDHRDVLADVLEVFGDDSALHWTELADRLDAHLGERWADVTPAAITAQLRDLGVPSRSVTRAGVSNRGCYRQAVAAAREGDRALV